MKWKDKLTNRINQVRPGYGSIVKYIERNSGNSVVEDELKDEAE